MPCTRTGAGRAGGSGFAESGLLHQIMRSRLAFVVVIAWMACWPVQADARGQLDAALDERAASAPSGQSRVILITTDSEATANAVLAAGGIPGRRLPGLGAQVALVPHAALRTLAAYPSVQAVRIDRAVSGSMVPVPSVEVMRTVSVASTPGKASSTMIGSEGGNSSVPVISPVSSSMVPWKTTSVRSVTNGASLS